MVANTNPIFGLVLQTAWTSAITTADTSMTAPSTGGALIMTAGADGSFVRRVFVKSVGTNVVTVVRLFVNNGSALSTAANNALIKEMTLPATTATQVAALTDWEIPLNLMLKGGYKLYASIGTAIAAGVVVTAEYQDY